MNIYLQDSNLTIRQLEKLFNSKYPKKQFKKYVSNNKI